MPVILVLGAWRIPGLLKDPVLGEEFSCLSCTLVNKIDKADVKSAKCTACDVLDKKTIEAINS